MIFPTPPPLNTEISGEQLPVAWKAWINSIQTAINLLVQGIDMSTDQATRVDVIDSITTYVGKAVVDTVAETTKPDQTKE